MLVNKEKATYNIITDYLQSSNKKPDIRRFYSLLNKADKKAIKNYIDMMPYRSFLRTSYWVVIIERVRQRFNYRCALCNSPHNTAVHHRTYKHHGMEHLCLEDLILLCKNCHSKFHDK